MKEFISKYAQVLDTLMNKFQNFYTMREIEEKEFKSLLFLQISHKRFINLKNSNKMWMKYNIIDIFTVIRMYFEGNIHYY